MMSHGEQNRFTYIYSPFLKRSQTYFHSILIQTSWWFSKKLATAGILSRISAFVRIKIMSPQVVAVGGNSLKA